MIKTLGSHASEVSLGAAQNALFLGLGVVSDLGIVHDGEARPAAAPLGSGPLRSVAAGALAKEPDAVRLEAARTEAVRADAVRSDVSKADSELSGRPTVAAHVLVCDDETRLGDLTAGLLEECGFAAGFVPSAVDAMAYLDLHADTRVLLLDVNLSGGKSAQDLLAFLVARPERLRVVLTSGSARQEVRTELTHHPLVVGYLEKPYAEEELTAAITSALAVD
jgi:CheY-like chemotaxis protein